MVGHVVVLLSVDRRRGLMGRARAVMWGRVVERETAISCRVSARLNSAEKIAKNKDIFPLFWVPCRKTFAKIQNTQHKHWYSATC